jgi:hypothetical protein
MSELPVFEFSPMPNPFELESVSVFAELPLAALQALVL